MTQDLTRSQRLQIRRCHGEISRMLDTAEILCPAEKRKACTDISCPFDPDQEGCRLSRHRELTGPTQPIGLCIHAEESGADILCKSEEDCEYRVPSIGDTETFYCSTEAVALALAEEKERRA